MAEFPMSEGAKDLIAAHTAISEWETYIGIMPDTADAPHKAIMISDTGGLEPNPRWLLDFPSISIMVRGKTNEYLETWREAKAIKDILLGLPAQDLNDDRWVSVTLQSDVSFLGRDSNMRPLFSMNFRLIIEPQVVAGTNRLAL